MCKVTCEKCKHYNPAKDAGRKLCHGRCMAKMQYKQRTDPRCIKNFKAKE